MKYRIWSKLSNCYTHEPCYPGSSLHCASNYYLDTDGNLVDFVTSISGNQDDASKCDVDQEAYKIELCTNFKTINGEYIYEGDIVELPLGIKTTIGRVVYEHFGFMVHERNGSVLQFVQRKYKYLGNYNKNPEILKTTVKIDNVGGH
jgi:ribosomal protein L24E